MTDTAARRVVAAAADLLFAARIRAAAVDAGIHLDLARSPEALRELAADASLVLLDLDARWLDAGEVIRSLRADPATASAEVVAFVSHVHVDRIEAARAAGADRVMARSAFVRELPALLTGRAAGDGRAGG